MFRRWRDANEALAAVHQEWNGAMRAVSIASPANYHAAGSPLPDDLRARWPGGLGTAAFGLPGRGVARGNQNPAYFELVGISLNLASGLRDYEQLVGWTKFARPWSGHNEHTSERNRLWFRCASVWIADVPVRTALGWNFPVPAHAGQKTAMFTGRGDYLRVVERVRGHVSAKEQEIARYEGWLRDFAMAWSARTMAFTGDLIAGAHRSLGDPVLRRMRALKDDPRVAPQFNEYGDALVALQAQMLAINIAAGNPVPTRQQAAAATARVARAAVALRNAVNAVPATP